MEDRELKGHLERLSQRGEPRGAGAVLAAARMPASWTARRFAPAVAVAAAVSLIAGVAGAIVLSGDDRPPTDLAANPLDTVPPSSTTTAAPVEVEIPTRLINQSRLVPFGSCSAVANYMRSQALRTVSAWGLPSYGGFGGGNPVLLDAAGGRAAAATAAEDSAAPRQSAQPAPPDSYSKTNVQEAGIDEPDIVKTDGRRIYAINGDKLFVVAADEPRVLGSITVGYPHSMFLVGTKVMVFSALEPSVATDSRGSQQYRPKVRISVIDVSNPGSPKETSHLDVDGGFISARLIDGVARVVIGSSPTAMPFVYPTEPGDESRRRALEKNRQVVREATFEDWLPRLTVTTGGKTSPERPAVNCADAFRPPAFSGFGMVSVLSVNPNDAAGAKGASVAADGQIVYSSADRLYVGTNQWGDLRPAEMSAPTVQPVAKTLIHQFDISDPAQARYLVSGQVRGTMLNQFSMSEHAGNLRVATTDRDESFVTVLTNQAGKVLGEIGQVGGLGKNERIYAVRFIGPVGYVVTFRQVDPLYVLDLRNPAKPRVTGELKITGYSAYLHPVSDTLLIGVGQEATEQGRRLGTLVSLFDVSDPANPRLVRKHVMGQGGSDAEYDHHAFLYWAPKQLTVIPVQEYNENRGGPGFMGAIGLRTTPDEIREVGRVSHDNFNNVQRSIVIGDRLFTYSNGGIKASNLDTLAEQAWVPFPNAPQYDRGDSEPAPQPEER